MTFFSCLYWIVNDSMQALVNEEEWKQCATVYCVSSNWMCMSE